MTDPIDAVYAALPAMQCKRLCQECCYSVAMTGPERARIEARHGIRIEDGFHPDGCPALGWFGQCSVYDDRPLICRLWGVVPSMRCPHGCEPDGGMLTDQDGFAALRQIGSHR